MGRRWTCGPPAASSQRCLVRRCLALDHHTSALIAGCTYTTARLPAPLPRTSVLSMLSAHSVLRADMAHIPSSCDHLQACTIQACLTAMSVRHQHLTLAWRSMRGSARAGARRPGPAVRRRDRRRPAGAHHRTPGQPRRGRLARRARPARLRQAALRARGAGAAGGGAARRARARAGPAGAPAALEPRCGLTLWV